MSFNHFDGWNTIEGRHLVFAYAAIFLIQGGYLAWMIRTWLRLGAMQTAAEKKAAKPVLQPASLSEEYRR